MMLAIKAIVPYVIAFGLLGMGGVLLRHTSAYTRVGGDEYERRMKRKTIAIVLLIGGGMFLLLAILNNIEMQVAPPPPADQTAPATPPAH
jgi:hypothetical protein